MPEDTRINMGWSSISDNTRTESRYVAEEDIDSVLESLGSNDRVQSIITGEMISAAGQDHYRVEITYDAEPRITFSDGSITLETAGISSIGADLSEIENQDEEDQGLSVDLCEFRGDSLDNGLYKVRSLTTRSNGEVRCYVRKSTRDADRRIYLKSELVEELDIETGDIIYVINPIVAGKAKEIEVK